MGSAPAVAALTLRQWSWLCCYAWASNIILCDLVASSTPPKSSRLEGCIIRPSLMLRSASAPYKKIHLRERGVWDQSKRAREEGKRYCGWQKPATISPVGAAMLPLVALQCRSLQAPSASMWIHG